MDFWIYFTISALFGYLLGSIPFALIIGKLFYKIDVRDYGSHNLGTTNVGRVLGKKAAIFVLIFDSLKSCAAGLLLYFLSDKFIGANDYSFLFYLVSALMACVGHCFPVFAKFRGGKAVATMFGFLAFTNYKLLIIFLLVFIIIVLTAKIVSVASISSVLVVTLSSFIPFIRVNNFYLNSNLNYLFTTLTLFLISILLIIRHIPNLKRLVKKEEKKFEFKK